MKFDIEIPSVVRSQINHVISGALEEYDGESVAPSQIKDYMEAQGWECGDLDTNGWEYDWWLNFTKGGKKLTACGSGYYGWFSLGKSDE